MFDVIREIEIFDNEEAKFYVGCLLLVLEHLHNRRIIYRDLKPENIIITDNGYPILFNFDFSKKLLHENGKTIT